MPLSQLYDTFFETIKPFKRGNLHDMQVGQVAMVPTCFIDRIPSILEAERAVASAHDQIKFKIRPMSGSDFAKKQRLPVASLRLNETEECIVKKAKKRPCILIARGNQLTHDSLVAKELTTRPHIDQDNAYFLPLYGIVGEGHRGGFPPLLVDRIKVLMYPQFFYLKPYSPKQSVCDFLMIESIARLDQVFPFAVHHPGVTPVDVKLSDEMLGLLQSWLARLLNIPLSAEKSDALELVLELLKDHFESSQATTQ